MSLKLFANDDLPYTIHTATNENNSIARNGDDFQIDAPPVDPKDPNSPRTFKGVAYIANKSNQPALADAWANANASYDPTRDDIGGTINYNGTRQFTISLARSTDSPSAINVYVSASSSQLEGGGADDGTWAGSGGTHPH
ncbi:MAG: hypothetical protein ABI451_03550 [Dokdonella sp.]